MKLKENYFQAKLKDWEELLKYDFYSTPDFKGGVWAAIEYIWDKKTIESISIVQLETIFKTISNQEALNFLPQISTILSLLESWYPNQRQLISQLIENKTVTCSSQLQYFIDKDFITTKNQKKINLPNSLKDFIFSQYLNKEEANIKAQHVIDIYKNINDEQAYLLITGIFGLKHLDKKLRKQLSELIKTSSRYSDSNLENLPLYELEALEALT